MSTTRGTAWRARLRQWSRDPRVGWGAWFVVVLGVLNAGAPHAVAHRFFDQVGHDRFVLTPSSALVALASSVTDEGDVRRYYAYANASLGRPYASYFVRPIEEWLPEFQSGNVPVEADSFPVRSPGRRLVPYRDFLVEYPPSFFLWAVPLALPSPNEDVFRFLFCTAMALCIALSIRVCQRLSSLVQPEATLSNQLPFWIVIACASVGLVTTHRFDALVGLLLCGACWALSSRRPVALGATFGGAVAVKLVPAIAAPWVALVLIRERRWKELAIAVAVALGTMALCYAPAIGAAGSRVFDIVRYHSARPLQVESSFAALLGLWRVVEPGSLVPVWSYGSSNVEGAHTATALRLSLALTVVGLAVVCASLWRRLGVEPDLRARLTAIAAHLLATLVVFMVFAKVFSPQYLVWILPLGILISLVTGRHTLLLFLVVLAMTQWIFPGAYRSVESLKMWTCALVLTRNGLLALWAWRLCTARPLALRASSA